MGRSFYSSDDLGMPYASVGELSFILTPGKTRRQLSRRPKLVLLLSGECHVKAGDDFSHSLGSGDLFILPTPCHHYYRLEKGSPSRQYVFTIFFEPRVLSPQALRYVRQGTQRELLEISRNLLSAKRYFPNAMTPSISALLSRWRQEHDEALPGWKVRVRSLTDALLVELWRTVNSHKPSPALQSRSRRYVVNQVKEMLIKSRGTPLTLSRLAWHVGWSEEHLARVFRQETGATVMSYLRGIRIDSARTRLLESSDSISRIATDLGFSTVGSFCRAFKQTIGQTPTQFRANHPGDRS